MSKKLRRTFTPDFKLQCVLDIISGRKRPVQIVREHNISESLLSRWRQQFVENAIKIFESQQHNAFHTRIAELERLVGQLTLELSASKKLLGYCDSR